MMSNRLKSLELQGYKTFARRTNLEFAGAVTAIVGPNGSGKTNVADALRWVLGEQSYNLLRGKRTEDMIFSGSEQRPRSGMASTSVVFDNSDNWLPIDFSEVAITRRAYRDGTNEYLLNGQRVRLRDVSELLAQSGLAQRTYTIIGQGLVDAALALKAEERRKLFEEAAGIGLHRARREETLRRLEITRRNLEQVQFILAELQPHLVNLERQAQRAREYDQIKADLQVLLREWYGYHWHKMQQDLVLAQDAVRSQEKTLETGHQKQFELETEHHSFQEKIEVARNQVNAFHNQLAQLHSHRESTSRQLAVASERIHSFEIQIQNIFVQIARIVQEIDLFQSRYDNSVQDVGRLDNVLNEARSGYDAARTHFNECRTKREAIEQEIREKRQSLGDQTNRASLLQGRMVAQREQVVRLEDLLEKSTTHIMQSKEDIQRGIDRAAESQALFHQAAMRREQLNASFLEKQRLLSEHEQQLKVWQSEQAELRAEMTRLNTQIDVLQQAEDSMIGYGSGARLLLDAVRRTQLDGVTGILGERFVIPVELEAAISALLGDYVDAVLLDQKVGLDQFLDLLITKNKRGILLPLSLSIPNSEEFKVIDINDEDSILGLARDLITYAPEVRDIVDILLGDALVVRDRSTASQVIRHHRSKQENGSITRKFRIVTLKGEIFHSSGVVQTGGAVQPVLSRTRQLREAQEALGPIEAQIVLTEHQIAQINRIIDDENGDINKIRDQLRAAQIVEDRANLTHKQDSLFLEQAKIQLDLQREERRRIESEMKRAQSEIKLINEEILDNNDQITILQKTLQAKLSDLDGIPLADYDEQVTYWRTQALVAEKLAQEARSHQEERRVELQKAQELAKTLQDQRQELEDGLALIEGEKTELIRIDKENNLQIEELREEIDPMEADISHLEENLVKIRAEEIEARQTVSIMEHQFAQARINLVRQQESLETLQHRIEEDFGLVSFEYASEVTGPVPLPFEGMVEQLPRLNKIQPELEDMIRKQRAQLRRVGPVNPEAILEYKKVKDRFQFLTDQVNDLSKAEIDIHQVIAELDELMQREFQRIFTSVAVEFRKIFSRLFGGGSARLVLTDPDDLLVTGIDIEARLPGRREQGLSLLSGGERSLTAVALVFSLLRVSPTPFCVLDEVDAMLDEVNVERFRDLLRELSEFTQFIIITHNRNTVQVADVIYGVTMGSDSTSQVISLKLDEIHEIVD